MIIMMSILVRKTTTILFALLVFTTFASAQETQLKPEWWFGGGLGANLNMYSGEIKTLTPANVLPSSFTGGSGVGLFLAPMLEYRPDPVWGGILSLGFDSRRGSFDDVTNAGTTHTLSTSMNYLTIEPSVRMTPFENGFYFFAGPRLGFNLAKTYTHEWSGNQVGTQEGEWDNIRGTVITGQIGAGYDIPITDPDAKSQTQISPFFSFHFGQGPRSIESWSLTTLRVGVAVKFGSTTELTKKVEKEIQFSTKAPKLIPNERRVRETFPMRNYVFFDEGSTQIPDRYIRLAADDAKTFSEEKLLQPQPQDLTGRSRRQLTVYHNILNILGDRLRKNSSASVTLTGASLQGETEGKTMAEAVKSYLVQTFGIERSRINTEGRVRPEHPSSAPGGTHELDLVKPEDRRVDITSNNLVLLQPVQIISLQGESFDSDVIFTVRGAEELLSSWNVDVTDPSGHVERYGPYTTEQGRVSGKTILGDRRDGKYTVAMVAETKGGQSIRKEETIMLAKSEIPEDSLGLRFSILFEFDESKTVATYANFLTQTVAPLVPDGGSVIIHGHTDIVGEESHNLKLSQGRAHEAQRVIEKALRDAGKKRVKFDAYGFGEDVRRAPFDDKLPEERFYNRTVIIDIVPEQ
jgi:outer membrane protein OmpA-like peptidoglycan-associated protein